MSDSVLLSRNPLASPLPAASSAASVTVLKDVPPELLRLPVGTILSVAVVPPESPAGYTVLNVTLPDGETVAFETKMTVPENFETQMNLKILPNDNKETLAVRLFSADKTDSGAAVFAADVSAQSSAAVGDAVVKDTAVLNGWLLKNIPQSVKDSGIPFTPPLYTGGKIDFQIQSVSQNLSDFSPAVPPSATPADASAAPFDAAAGQQTPAPAAASTALPSAGSVSTQTGDTPTAPLTVPAATDTKAPAPTENVSPQTSGFKTETTDNNIPLLRPAAPPAAPQTTTAAQEILNTALSAEKPSAAPVSVPSASETAPTSMTPPPSPVAVASSASAPSGGVQSVLPEKAVQTPPAAVAPPPNVPKAPADRSAFPKSVQGVLFQPKGSEPPVIASDIGMIALNQKITLPHLSVLSLKITAAELPVVPLPDFAPKESSPWVFLNEAFENLQKTDSLAVESLKTVLPQVGNRLPTLMLSFMHTAAAGGDVRAWLGETNVQALQAMGKRGEAILKNIEKEFSTSVKKGTDGKSVWKGYDIPLMTGAAVEPVSLYLQQSSEALEERAKNKAAPVSSVRFVLDLNLTKLGRIQFEGLSQRTDRTFNLNIRYVYPLPEQAELRVREIFSKTLNAMNYAGTCSLKRTDAFIEIRPENEKTTDGKSGVWA